jgi:hypothetical protein
MSNEVTQAPEASAKREESPPVATGGSTASARAGPIDISGTLTGIFNSFKAAEDFVERGVAHALLVIGVVLIVLPVLGKIASIPWLNGLDTGEYPATILVGAALMVSGAIIRVVDSFSMRRAGVEQMSRYFAARTEAYKDYVASLDKQQHESPPPAIFI